MRPFLQATPRRRVIFVNFAFAAAGNTSAAAPPGGSCCSPPGSYGNDQRGLRPGQLSWATGGLTIPDLMEEGRPYKTADGSLRRGRGTHPPSTGGPDHAADPWGAGRPSSWLRSPASPYIDIVPCWHHSCHHPTFFLSSSWLIWPLKSSAWLACPPLGPAEIRGKLVAAGLFLGSRHSFVLIGLSARGIFRLSAAGPRWAMISAGCCLLADPAPHGAETAVHCPGNGCAHGAAVGRRMLRTAGIIVGVIALTGIGSRFSSVPLSALADAQPALLALIFAMLVLDRAWHGHAHDRGPMWWPSSRHGAGLDQSSASQR